MARILTPLDAWRATFAFGAMLAEAQIVIGLRMLGAMGAWSMPPGESVRMVAEKSAAMREAACAATNAAVRGKGPAAIAKAAVAPVRRRTRSNVRRLVKRGPARPAG